MSCCLLMGVFFSLTYCATQNGCNLSSSGAILRSSGTSLNYDNPEIKYDFVNRLLHCENQSFPFNDTLQDVHYLSKNQFITRSCEKDGTTTFALIQGGKECNSFSATDYNSALPDNQKHIIDAWGALKKKNKILIAWMEIFIQAKDPDRSIKDMVSRSVLEMVQKKSDDFYLPSANLKIFDIFPQSLENSPLSGQVPMSFEIQNFPLSSRFKRFPDKILFSPDSKYVTIQTESGFVLQSLIPTYPFVQAQIFSFPDVVSDDERFFQDCTLKWISNNQFWFVVYTGIVTKFLMYSLYGSAWWSDQMSDDTVNSINEVIEKFNDKEKFLLKLRLCNSKNSSNVQLLGIFLGVPEEQAIIDISTAK